MLKLGDALPQLKVPPTEFRKIRRTRCCPSLPRLHSHLTRLVEIDQQLSTNPGRVESILSHPSSDCALSDPEFARNSRS